VMPADFPSAGTGYSRIALRVTKRAAIVARSAAACGKGMLKTER